MAYKIKTIDILFEQTEHKIQKINIFFSTYFGTLIPKQQIFYTLYNREISLINH